MVPLRLPGAPSALSRRIPPLAGRDRKLELPWSSKTTVGLMQKHTCHRGDPHCKWAKSERCQGVHVAAMLAILTPKKCIGIQREQRERSRSRGRED